MKNLIIACLLLLLAPGCNQSPRQDFIVDKDQLMDIINNNRGIKKFTINRNEFNRILLPSDFYNSSVYAVEKENESELYSRNTLVENAMTQTESNYIFNIDKMVARDYFIVCQLEHYPDGGKIDVRLEIEIN